ncbi:MAG: arginine--tRNA ligase [Candidatus Sericytochromatia bacterium]|nr:arginine--tRNA ligase [Candidatus Sericytochromatia bacterium]
MLKSQIAAALTVALRKASEAGDFAVESLPTPGVEVPRDPQHGDYASNIAMVLAKPARMAPLKIAEAIARHASLDGPIASVEVAPPGFINLRLSQAWLAENLRMILRQQAAYGHSEVGRGERVLLEYVSANPTGPLHVGHGRWAAIGSGLAHVLRAAGFAVDQEFYVNDAGNQMQLLGRSLEARLRQRQGEAVEVPEDGYHGAYMAEVAARAESALGLGILQAPEEERLNALTDFARDTLLAMQQATLAQMGTRFDHYFSERSLHQAGRVDEAIARLKETGHLYQQDGAWWLRSTDFGDDKDRVVIRENGQPTYLAADIAYHWDKLQRGYTRLVNIMGADHHGYVARLSAAVQALGGEARTLHVIIGQMVNLFRDGEPVRMSKRSGEMVTLQEVLDEVGADAARYFLLMRSTDTTLDFDLALAVKESADNPVFYVQYAHARICSILRMAQQAHPGLVLEGDALSDADLSLLVTPDERQLLLKLALFPDEVASAALAMEPYRIARFAQELAAGFHQFYTNCRVLTDDQALMRARLALIIAARIVLRNALADLLGVSAPERMESLAVGAGLPTAPLGDER